MTKGGIKNIIPRARLGFGVRPNNVTLAQGSPIGPGFFLFLTYAQTQTVAEPLDFITRVKISSISPKVTIKSN